VRIFKLELSPPPAVREGALCALTAIACIVARLATAAPASDPATCSRTWRPPSHHAVFFTREPTSVADVSATEAPCLLLETPEPCTFVP
jgi:hypothetical protein